VLPTGRIFGRLPQKRPNKKKCGRKNLAPNFGRHCAERAKKGPNFWKVCFSTLLPLNFTFPTDTNKDNFVSNGKKTPSKRGNCYGADLFPQRPNFSAELARKVCQELATLWEPIVASS
jgi:hypothetical protein